jgi:putative (di)nucleoside polyphosphate hydrolase
MVKYPKSTLANIPTRNIVRTIVYDPDLQEPLYLILEAKKGYWQNPQGGIDNGESPLEAAIRELKEETGIESTLDDIHEDTEHHIEYITESKGNCEKRILKSYAIKADSSKPVTLCPQEEHTSYMWATKEQVYSMLTRYKEQLEVFEQVVRKLRIKQ